MKDGELLGGHDNCIICGRNNPFSLGLKFQPVEGNTVEASFVGGPHLQGYEGILHGGVISAVLDSAMAHCLLLQDIKAVTGDLRVRFLQSIPCSSRVIIRAWLTCAVSTLYELKAEARVDGKLVARAKAKFMQKEGVK
jgi:acyl-coenzyme A thioesterase PaaI-like protein